MDWGITWASAAWDDIEETAIYIARDSQHYAAVFIRQVRDAARSLRTLPHRGRIVPELNDPTIRELRVGHHRLIYQVGEGAVNVLAVVHGARDLETFWKRAGRG